MRGCDAGARTLVVGDMHVKQRAVLPIVGAAAAALGARRVVFLGDYCDEWGMADDDMLDALDFQLAWAAERRAEGLRVEFLLGNHDFCYLEAMPEHYTSIRALAAAAERLMKFGLRAATVVGGALLTHAGVTARWAAANDVPTCSALAAADVLNGMLDGGDEALASLYSCGPERGGAGLPGPLWAGYGELVRDAAPGLVQVVGHTPQPYVAIKPSIRGDLVAFADTFSVDRIGEAIGDGSILLATEGPGGLDLEPVRPEEVGRDPWPAALARWQLGMDE